jgi:hypothetical protein
MDLDIFVTTGTRANLFLCIKLQLGLNQGENEASAPLGNGKSGTVAGLPHIGSLRSTASDHGHGAAVLRVALLGIT